MSNTIMTAEAVIKASDKTGGVFAAIASKIGRINAAAAAANRGVVTATRQATLVNRMNSGIDRAQGSIVAASARVLAPAAVAYAGTQAFKRYADTDLAITRIGITAESTDQEIQGLRKSLRDLAFLTGKPFDEVAKGLDNIVAAGQDLPAAMKLLPAIAKTAQASGAEMSDMANTAIALQQSLKIDAAQMQSAFDILNTAGKSGKFELKDLSKYLASIGPAAAVAGFKGEEGLKKLAAMLETIRAGTGTSDEAADSMINILQKIESQETTNKFKKFGVDLPKAMTKARKEGKDLISTFLELTQTATRGDLSKIPQLIQDLQFSRGVRALLTYKDTYEDVMRRINETSKGSTMVDFDRVLKRPRVAIDRLSESWDRLKESAGAAIAAMGAPDVLDKLSKTLEQTADYYNAPAIERARLDEEKRRREEYQPRIDEAEAKISYLEKAERDRTQPSWLQHMRGEKLAPLQDRLENDPVLRQLRAKLYDLQGGLHPPAKNEDMPPVFSAAEVETLQEIDRERRRGEALSRMGQDLRPPQQIVPLPTADPRRRPVELPPVQPLDTTSADTETKSGDVWTAGTKAIGHLDQSEPAAAAGEKSAGAYKDAFEAELKSVDTAIQAAMARWSAMLGSFSASPTIIPNIAAPAGAGKQSSAGGGQKVGSIDSPSRQLHGTFGDYGFDTVG